jgi:hypothetical protein
VFGLIRRDALKTTSLIGRYWSSDRVLLAELSLIGRFHEIDEELFFRRKHTAQSTELTVQNKARWVDSKVRLAVPFQVHAVGGYLRAAWRAPLPWPEKAQCYGVVGEWALRRVALKVEGLRTSSEAPQQPAAGAEPTDAPAVRR